MKRSVGLRCTICNHPARPQMLCRDNSRLSPDQRPSSTSGCRAWPKATRLSALSALGILRDAHILGFIPGIRLNIAVVRECLNKGRELGNL